MNLRFIACSCTLLTIATSLFALSGSGNTLSQVSTIGALLSGIYDGSTTLGSLKTRGDFGLGTVNGLNGEMVFLNDTFFRIDVSGAVAVPEDTTRTPFAAVTFFHATDTFDLPPGMSLDAAEKKLDSLLQTPNIFYAVKITGSFETLRARSVPRQHAPYHPLQEAVKSQAVFKFTSIRGTVAGFRCPGYAGGITVAGWHLHFISDLRDRGGHVLDFTTGKCRAEIDCLRNFRLALPDDSAFNRADLSENKAAIINKVEK